jgi:hypothetical protein
MHPADDEPLEEVLEGHVRARASRSRRLSEKWLLRLVVVLAVIAAGSIATAVHYRSDVAEKAQAAPTASTITTQFHPLPPPGGSLRVADARLPVLGGQPGVVAVIHGSAGRSRSVVIAAQLTGLTPGHHYQLIGNDCRGKVPDFVWARGTASRTGALLLATFPRVLDTTHVYWVSLYRPHALTVVGVFGAFASGAVMPFQGGHGPCSL